MSFLKKQRAFTFIELLIVVTIIALMSAVLVVDFRGARETQDLASAVDQGLALLQQSQLEVRSGLVELDDTDVEEGDEETILQSWQCRGAIFRLGTLPLYAQGDFLLDDDKCEEPELESYGIGSENVGLKLLDVEGINYESVLVLFEPPNGDPSIWGKEDEDGDFESLNGDVYLKYAHKNNDDLASGLHVGYLTSSVRILSAKEIEEYEE